MARTLQFEQESLPAETGRQARALGQALQALADGLTPRLLAGGPGCCSLPPRQAAPGRCRPR
ncbi:MAG: hypothetical protein ACLUUL_07345 [Gemmiger sp.]